MFFSFCISQAAALAFYILSALFINNFVIIFMMTVLLAALDFWVVKNLSGRILVGLRWWNEINDLGESVWKFESLDQQVQIACFAQLQLACCYLTFWIISLYPVMSLLSCIRLQSKCYEGTSILHMVFVFRLVIGSDEQERFMAFLVDALPYSKKTSIGHTLEHVMAFQFFLNILWLCMVFFQKSKKGIVHRIWVLPLLYILHNPPPNNYVLW